MNNRRASIIHQKIAEGVTNHALNYIENFFTQQPSTPMPQGAFLTFFSSSSRTLDLGAVFSLLHFIFFF